MGNLNYLELCNRVVRRITQTDLTDVTTATGQAKIICDMVNEAQVSVSLVEDWYTLYATRTFDTVAATATYDYATDFGRCINLVDTTSKRVLTEIGLSTKDGVDMGNLTQGTPTHVVALGTQYSLYPIPSGVFTIRENYWRKVTALSANTDTPILPHICDNLIIFKAWRDVLEYLNKFDAADRVEKMYAVEYASAILANRKILNQMHIFRDATRVAQPGFPQLPARFGRGWN